MNSRFSKYRAMWLFVSFDLPTNTRSEKTASRNFRLELLKDGFAMFQYSIYLRACSSKENTLVHENRIIKKLPKYGIVSMLKITDHQYNQMKVFLGRNPGSPDSDLDQLTMF